MFLKRLNQTLLKYSDKNILYALTILECIEKCFLYSKDFSNAETFFYHNNQQAYNATCHLLLAIGEEAKKLEPTLKEEITFINWEDVIAVRNRIAHDYRGIDKEIVYKICKNELKVLKEAVVQLVQLINNQQLLQTYLQSDYFSHVKYLIK